MASDQDVGQHLREAEDKREKAEDGRQDAEQGRQCTEAHRVAAESTRTEADQFRALAEEARELRDQHREALEQLREAAERQRQASEANRIAAEDARAATESARHAAMEAIHATTDAMTASLEHMKIVEEMRRALARSATPVRSTTTDAMTRGRVNSFTHKVRKLGLTGDDGRISQTIRLGVHLRRALAALIVPMLSVVLPETARPSGTVARSKLNSQAVGRWVSCFDGCYLS